MIGPPFEAVLAAAAGGDDAAFGVLWRDLQPGLLRYLNAMAPGSGEDLASETWLRVVGGLARFSGDERAFRAWVFTIARHRAVDRWRCRARRNDELVPVDTLVDLIATLPPDQAEVVLPRVVAGLEVAEVATITGKRPGNVRVLSHRALRHLAERLAEDIRVRGAV
jgi:RNA polymerase sigma-70 factor, ECF subfamily